MKNILLKLLNILNRNPNCYAFIDNIAFYDKKFIASFTGKTIDEFLKEMDLMDKCIDSKEDYVIQNGIAIQDDLTEHI